MNVKKIITLLLAALLVLSLAACGKKGSDDMTKSDSEPKNAQDCLLYTSPGVGPQVLLRHAGHLQIVGQGRALAPVSYTHLALRMVSL